MSMSVSLSLITQAAVPGASLAAVGLIWLYFWTPIRALPTVLFSLGVSLLVLVGLVVLVYSTSLVHALNVAIWIVIGVTLLVYIVSLAGCARITRTSQTRVFLIGLLGLIPLWFLGGFVLMSSVCSFGTGGC